MNKTNENGSINTSTFILLGVSSILLGVLVYTIVKYNTCRKNKVLSDVEQSEADNLCETENSQLETENSQLETELEKEQSLQTKFHKRGTGINKMSENRHLAYYQPSETVDGKQNYILRYIPNDEYNRLYAVTGKPDSIIEAELPYETTKINCAQFCENNKDCKAFRYNDKTDYNTDPISGAPRCLLFNDKIPTITQASNFDYYIKI